MASNPIRLYQNRKTKNALSKAPLGAHEPDAALQQQLDQATTALNAALDELAAELLPSQYLPSDDTKYEKLERFVLEQTYHYNHQHSLKTSPALEQYAAKNHLGPEGLKPHFLPVPTPTDHSETRLAQARAALEHKAQVAHLITQRQDHSDRNEALGELKTKQERGETLSADDLQLLSEHRAALEAKPIADLEEKIQLLEASTVKLFRTELGENRVPALDTKIHAVNTQREHLLETYREIKTYQDNGQTPEVGLLEAAEVQRKNLSQAVIALRKSLVQVDTVMLQAQDQLQANFKEIISPTKALASLANVAWGSKFRNWITLDDNAKKHTGFSYNPLTDKASPCKIFRQQSDGSWREEAYIDQQSGKIPEFGLKDLFLAVAELQVDPNFLENHGPIEISKAWFSNTYTVQCSNQIARNLVINHAAQIHEARNRQKAAVEGNPNAEHHVKASVRDAVNPELEVREEGDNQAAVIAERVENPKTEEQRKFDQVLNALKTRVNKQHGEKPNPPQEEAEAEAEQAVVAAAELYLREPPSEKHKTRHSSVMKELKERHEWRKNLPEQLNNGEGEGHEPAEISDEREEPVVMPAEVPQPQAHYRRADDVLPRGNNKTEAPWREEASEKFGNIFNQYDDAAESSDSDNESYHP